MLDKQMKKYAHTHTGEIATILCVEPMTKILFTLAHFSRNLNEKDTGMKVCGGQIPLGPS